MAGEKRYGIYIHHFGSTGINPADGNDKRSVNQLE